MPLPVHQALRYVQGAPSERFHWITAPRSDVLQSSPVHEGVGDPRKALEELFEFYVARC